MAAFYPGCRQCPHRDDTGTLSSRQVEQLAETRPRGEPRPLFHDEGAGGAQLNDLLPTTAHQIAAAFGVMAQQEGRGERGEGREHGEDPSIHHSSFIIHHSANPAVVLAGDGRPITAELVAAVGEGLRWSGCDLVDIGPATAACLAFAVHHYQAAGGVLVGNPGQEPQCVGVQFWAAGPCPLSVGGSLEPLVQLYQTGVSRPTRSFGALRRFQADVPYLAALSQHYHALRPLRVVVDSASQPLVEYLKRLAASVACQIIPCRLSGRDVPDQVRAAGAHFAVGVDGDGETCLVFDELGSLVPTERLLLLLGQYVDAASSRIRQAARCRFDKSGGAFQAGPSDRIVLESATPRSVVERLEQERPVVTSSPRRADMAAAMRGHGARFGGGPSGRFWHVVAGVPLPDALMTITRLLMLLSRSDEPLTAVLDGR